MRCGLAKAAAQVRFTTIAQNIKRTITVVAGGA